MSIVGEAALAAFFEVLFGKFSSTEFEFVTEKQVHKEIVKWETLLRTIHGLLADAEERQLKDKAVKIWLSGLQDLAYDVDDILDEFATEALGRKEHQASTSKAQNLVPTCCSSLHPSSIMLNCEMMSKIREITGRLEDLKAQRSTLQLSSNHVGRATVTYSKPPESTSLVNEADVYGRKEDKEKILDLVLCDDGTSGGVSVIPIVGMGGIGKTTLAQLVYNDDSIKDHFDLKAWVCVSDEFDIIRITKTIILSVISQPSDENNLNLLQVKLKEMLSRKKFLLVLDDVWNENYEDWTILRRPFDAGAPGSKIIVTTRSSNVSLVMRTVPDHSLPKLSDDDSLCLFAHHALGARDFSGYPDLKDTGAEIMKKCNGLPLATITVGGLLRTELNPGVWKGVLESGIWNLTDDQSRIRSALQLSYFRLSSQLKQCFAYCSLVPKDCEFEKEEMVLLWMAEGFLHQANTKVPSEDSGRRYFEELVSRSFFQVSSMNRSKFVMHDLINDLAQSVAGEFFFRTEEDGQTKYTGRPRHSSYIISHFDGLKKFDTFPKAEHLRTFLPFSMMRYRPCYLSNDVVIDLLPKLRRLRVLSLKGYKNISEIPESIGNLIHLRYLNFSGTEIKGLPDSICNLNNLESLLLRCCEKIEKLPSKIGNLANLYRLDIKGAESMKEMPSGIGKLTNLHALSKFIVGGGDGLNIREMQNLSNLKGELSISNLQNVVEAQDARGVALSAKSGLDILELKWCDDFNQNLRKNEVERKVLDLLQPQNDLKVLTIKYYAGTQLPTWIRDPSFNNLQSLKFDGCPNCRLLPAVGKLPRLKDLYIKGMSSVSSVGNEFYGENGPNVFTSLETLHFEDMPGWEKWNSCEVDVQGKKFPRLRELFIQNCPKLDETLSNDLPSLEKLEICGCHESVVHISNLRTLRELKIDGCKEVVFGSSTDLWSVKEIILSNISKFTCVGEEAMMSELVKVESLKIDGCEELVSLWQTKWGWLGPLRSLRTLKFNNCRQVVCIGAAAKEEETKGLLQLELPCNIKDMRIANCEGLEKLSKTFSNLMCLRQLYIYSCPKLVTIAVDSLPGALKTLEIDNCNSLQCLLDDGENINFSSTSLLESLEVDGCGGLQSLSASGKLPAALKSLVIRHCPSLGVIAGEFGDNACLEDIQLVDCENIKYLSQGVNKLSRLQWFQVFRCPNLICFPESGLPTTPNLIPERGLPLPTTLSSLHLGDEPNVSKALMEWERSHTLTSLTELYINGSNCTDTVSFPQSQEEEIVMNVMSMKLPSSLIDLTMIDFRNLRKLSSSGFRNLTSLRKLSIWHCPKLKSLPQNLTSLQSLTIIYCPKLKSLPQNLISLRSLYIWRCPKLKSLPKKEMLPSLVRLSIWDCPELKKRCKRDKGKLWSLVSHIPRVDIRD